MPHDAIADPVNAEADVIAFVDRWRPSGGAERSNYQQFLSELCAILGVAPPDPATGVAAQDVYVFDKPVGFKQPDGSVTTGFADLYKRGHFVCETKQGIDKQRAEADALAPPAKRRAGHGVRGSKGWDDAMLAARGQAEGYVRAIEGDNPPFVLVIDVGHAIDLYADFSRLGKIYSPFPDAGSHRVLLEHLVDPKVRARLRLLWTDPLALDPSRHSAKVTREIAAKLAVLTKSLERGGHHPEQVAQFLMRCLFTFFVEDIGLLCKDPKRFTNRLKELVDEPDNFPHEMRGIWQAMNRGDYAPALKEKLRHFNGGLFEHADALPLNGSQIRALYEAADRDWTEVEPAIFGTLLERALDADERHALGAHYTPRAYVERLVIPTIIEPLTDDWNDAKAAAVTLAKAGKDADAIAEVKRFLAQLCETKVLDPACGTGNFLYVAMARMKDLEGEVRLFLRQLGETQDTLEGFGQTVDPHQFLGIELNPRAAAIAELVLWIGYLQWQVRTGGVNRVKQPVLKAYHNIENRDAVLAYDERQLVLDEQGKPVSRWDGKSMKKSPVTGEDVPDETKRVDVFRYTNPRKAMWPKADFVVGNPPFIGNKRMRDALGSGYVDALRSAHSGVPEVVDLVMYWWSAAADLTDARLVQRFGLITTNSITQTFSRRVVERHLRPDGNLVLRFAFNDHPWTDSVNGAAVRIAMTVVERGQGLGLLHHIQSELEGDEDGATVEVLAESGEIHADLTIGAATGQVTALVANERMSFQGPILVGEGFRVEPQELRAFGIDPADKLPAVVRKYIIGRDVTQRHEERYVIDFFGLTETEARRDYPSLMQKVMVEVKPHRDANKDRGFRERWWLWGRPRPDLRKALSGLSRFVATVETAKHRVFVFVPGDVCTDHKLYAVATSDAWILGTLSSRGHVVWALAAGGTLEDRPTWTNGTCFLPFPFPLATDARKARIRDLGEQLDAHRKRQQAAHPGLTITDMYNVLAKLRAIEFQEAYANAMAAGKPRPTPTGGTYDDGLGPRRTGMLLPPIRPEVWSDKERRIHEQGLVSVLKQIHDDLDAAVFDAYGWPVDLTDEQILERLVALNHERAAEEARGIIRWLRPEYQNRGGTSAEQATIDVPDEADDQKPAKPATAAKTTKASKVAWPKTLAEQARAVRGVLAAGSGTTAAAMAKAAFKGAKLDRVEEILDTLVTLGQARRDAGGIYR